MLEGYKDMGSNMAIGKVESGQVKPGMKMVITPVGHKCTVTGVFINEEEMQWAGVGENVVLKMSGVQDDSLQKGFVMCDAPRPCRAITKFKAQLQVIELP